MYPDESIYRRISQNIRKYRKLNKLTQAQFAEMLSIDTQYYAQLERAERNFTLEKIVLSCKLLDVRIQDIVELDDPDDELNEETRKKRSDMLIEITDDLDSLNLGQLKILSKYMTDVLQYCSK